MLDEIQRVEDWELLAQFAQVYCCLSDVLMDQIKRSRGRLIQLSRSDYERSASLEGAYFVGSPQQIIDKLLYQYELFGHQRFMAQIDIGGLPFHKVAQTIELLATEVAPVIRRETARQPKVASS
jgi:alkanesulfonate monooxygenase SsuD/methylene tetrahydromethanopterin reductase-like flavin-dependent oxidoreductase (luciferase family)